MVDWNGLEARLAAASGGDHGLDAELAEAFARPPAPYTEAVEPCRDLVAAALPGWKLHVGFGVSGLFPYAALTRDGVHLDAEAPTLPLAILRAALQAIRR
ncbi:hypothetical protein [Magnetospirillum sp. UT-4]|uniref:hypothetical protein n=1 Tax=Magnetospirillum sp. UT-4 TaxID=2681467 RepID=UPI00138604AC|nr:hypothetical protein [Magnetospirillum sp. UT-4]CAA7625935.1 conserved hypothetical protein [Magnetospirillum sp. UT-4]